jgi:two-component system, OmpR family, response regulator RegX3
MPSDKRRVLVVDDEESILSFVAYNLERAGYEVVCADTGDRALECFAAEPFDVVILDVMLPGADGLEVCKRLRAGSDVPVLFLSAKDSEVDKVVGLELGGDDYLAKPFGIHELLARVKALLRRAPASDPAAAAGGPAGAAAHDGLIEVHGLRIDEPAHLASYDGNRVDLTPREFELLVGLARHAGHVLSREQLLTQAWGWENLVATKTVDTHVKRLRDKLLAAGADADVIETVRGYGYRLRK